MVSQYLGQFLDGMTVEGELYEQLPDKAVRCFACGHRCLIREGRRGICQVRFNQDGKLPRTMGLRCSAPGRPD